ncbi:N-acetyltransferase [Rickettsiales endosymbiont of Stachyamoeba lipophora]|nr:N-acetyltransferase [Rickettsiales endosymbiont of Stachyamoeba lipophora]
MQNKGYGASLIHLIEKWALYQEKHTIYLHAPETALNFYLHAGYSIMNFEDSNRISKTNQIDLGKALT